MFSFALLFTTQIIAQVATATTATATMMAKMILQMLHSFLAVGLVLATVVLVVFLVVVALVGVLTVLVVFGVADLLVGLAAGFFAEAVLVLVVVVDFLRVSATITPLLKIVLTVYYSRDYRNVNLVYVTLLIEAVLLGAFELDSGMLNVVYGKFVADFLF